MYFAFYLVCGVAAMAALAPPAFAETLDAGTWSGAPIHLDGKLDEDAWRRAPVQSLSSLKDYGAEGVKTELRVLHDASALYLGVLCYEPKMAQMRSAVTQRDNMICMDDCIEIFVDPGHSKEHYYQMLFNSLGTQQDLEVLEGGRVFSKLWNGGWRVAVNREGGRWSAEAAIPWASLGGWKLLETRIGLNVTRERYATGQQQLYSWSRLDRFHDPARFNELRVLALDPARLVVGNVTLGTDVEPEGEKWRVFVESTVTFNRPPPSGWTVHLLEAETRRELASAKGEGTQKARVVLPPFERAGLGALTTIVEVKDASGALMGSRIVPVELRYEPIRVEITRPAYRNTFYASEPATEIEGVVRLGHRLVRQGGAGGRLQCRLTDAAEKVVASGEFPVGSMDTVFKLACPALAEGNYTLECRYERGASSEAVAATVALHRVPKPASGNEVRLDAEGRLLLNGAPFVPIGWYGVEWIGAVRKGFAAFPKEVNFFDNNRPAENDALYAGGKYFSLEVHHGKFEGSKHTEWDKRDDLSDAMRKNVKAFIEQYRSHPGLLAWYLADEPEIWDVRPLWLEDFYRYIAELDPYHPCYVIHDSLVGLKIYASAADIQCPDPYFIPSVVGSLQKLKSFLQAARPKEGTARGLWATLQTFGYHQMGLDILTDPAKRCPTYRETRAVHLYGIMLGAAGFADFMPQTADSDPELRIGMPHIQKEIAWLKPYITAAASAALPCQSENPSVEIVGKRVDGKDIVIAVNVSGSPVEARLRLGGEGEWRVVPEDRTVTPSGAVITDSFQPFDVHIYCNDPKAGEGLVSPRKVDEEIAAYRAAIKTPEGNVMRLDNVAMICSSGSTYSYGEGLFDGITDGLGWSPMGDAPRWIEFVFRKECRPVRAIIHSPNLGHFEVQGWTGESWVSIGQGNGAFSRLSGGALAPVKTEVPLSTPKPIIKLRVLVPNTGGEINEIWVMEESAI